MKFTCPVCGYDGINEPSLAWAICPSCGVQFNYTDAGRTHVELRATWIAYGMQWASEVIPTPPGWDPLKQLERVSA